ncbi:MAG: hypothetical protein NTX72_02475 [Candidatus Uhrbacteria bacterium]|nr:hypothetical protein [Candidatus Uhrbacteria bacterium]
MRALFTFLVLLLCAIAFCYDQKPTTSERAYHDAYQIVVTQGRAGDVEYPSCGTPWDCYDYEKMQAVDVKFLGAVDLVSKPFPTKRYATVFPGDKPLAPSALEKIKRQWVRARADVYEMHLQNFPIDLWLECPRCHDVRSLATVWATLCKAYSEFGACQSYRINQDAQDASARLAGEQLRRLRAGEFGFPKSSDVAHEAYLNIWASGSTFEDFGTTELEIEILSLRDPRLKKKTATVVPAIPSDVGGSIRSVSGVGLITTF